jgi:hypothetical protein
MPLLAAAKARVGGLVSGILPIGVPKLEVGKGKLHEIGAIAKKAGMTRPLIVTDAVIAQLGLLESTLQSLAAAGLPVTVFDKVLPDPTDDMVEAGVAVCVLPRTLASHLQRRLYRPRASASNRLDESAWVPCSQSTASQSRCFVCPCVSRSFRYRENKCDGIIAVGGGSPMDCAKLIGAVIVRPQPVEKFAGAFTVRRKLPPFIAVPTTAGTGSETTIAAILTIPWLLK